MKYSLAIIFSILAFVSKAQTLTNLVQVDGVVMTSDSMHYVSNATVMVKNQAHGVECSKYGVFSIVCYKGDTLVFSELGFRRREVVIPEQVQGLYYSMVVLMVQDTFYLPETIVRPLPTREEFAYAFQYWRIPFDQYEIAQMNTNRFALRAIAYTLPRDGRENQALYQAQQANNNVWTGMPNGAPMNILNPFAWSDFFQAWKKGDFRNLNNNYGSYNPSSNH